VECFECIHILREIGDAFNSPMRTQEVLELASKSISQHLNIKAVHFRLLSQDQKQLEDVASFGLSPRFLDKGPVDAEKSATQALSGNVIFVEDCLSDPRVQYPDAHREEGIASTLTVPLRTRGQVIGVMRWHTAEKRIFNPIELNISEVVASFCTRVIMHSMFHEILEHVTDAIRSSMELPEVLGSITRVITEDLRAKGCAIHVLNAKTKNLNVGGAYGLGESFLAGIKGKPQGALKEVLEGRCVLIENAMDDPRTPCQEKAREEQIGTLLMVPLILRDRPLGILCLCTHHPYLFSEDELFFLRSIGEQTALAIQNAQMYAAVRQRYERLVEDFHQWFGAA
jgi:GAF domain-containing protein